MLLAAVWRVQVDRYSLFDLRYSLSTVYRLQTTAIVISHSLQSTVYRYCPQSTVYSLPEAEAEVGVRSF